MTRIRSSLGLPTPPNSLAPSAAALTSVRSRVSHTLPTFHLSLFFSNPPRHAAWSLPSGPSWPSSRHRSPAQGQVLFVDGFTLREYEEAIRARDRRRRPWAHWRHRHSGGVRSIEHRTAYRVPSDPHWRHSVRSLHFVVNSRHRWSAALLGNMWILGEMQNDRSSELSWRAYGQ